MALKFQLFLKVGRDSRIRGEIGKSIGMVHEDIYCWFIIHYLSKQKEYEAAFQELIRQLTDETPLDAISDSYCAIPVLKNVNEDKKKEYLHAAIYFLH